MAGNAGQVDRRDYVHHTGLRLGQERWNQVFLDGVGVDFIIDLGKRALEVPFQCCGARLFVLEALELLDKVELEFRTEP